MRCVKRCRFIQNICLTFVWSFILNQKTQILRFITFRYIYIGLFIYSESTHIVYTKLENTNSQIHHFQIYYIGLFIYSESTHIIYTKLENTNSQIHHFQIYYIGLFIYSESTHIIYFSVRGKEKTCFLIQILIFLTLLYITIQYYSSGQVLDVRKNIYI